MFGMGQCQGRLYHAAARWVVMMVGVEPAGSAWLPYGLQHQNRVELAGSGGGDDAGKRGEDCPFAVRWVRQDSAARLEPVRNSTCWCCRRCRNERRRWDVWAWQG